MRSYKRDMITSYKGLLLVAALCCTVTAGIAQKKNFTIAEATNGISTTLAPKGIRQAGWEPGTNMLYQVVKGGGQDVWIRTAYPSGKTDTMLRISELNNNLRTSLKAMPTLSWMRNGEVYINNNNNLIKGTLTAAAILWNTWLELPEDAENITVDKSGQVAYTIKNNLWLATRDRRQQALTADANENIINGQSVHRNEFGINGGIFFSPEGNYLAYYRMDQTMVADYPIINWMTTPAKNKNIKYPMAGATSHEVKLCIYNNATGKTTTLQVDGPADQYLTCISWSPDERYVFIAVLNRDQNHLWLNQYDIYTGRKVRTILEETHKKYVEPQHGLTFIPGTNDQFIWWSQRDGYMHLYRYRTDGRLVQQLTKGKWLVNELVAVDKVNKQLIITASKESPLEKHIYSVDYNNGNITRIDAGSGVHTPVVNDKGTYLLDVYSNATTPKKSVVRSTTGSFSKTLLDAPDPLANYHRPEVRNITLQAEDGTPLYGKLILPTNFDSNKRYPVIVYLYGGPHAQLIRNIFPASGNLWYEYMAQRGYIVFSMDGRGSSNRGLAFEQAVFRTLGTLEMEDQLEGVAYLKSLPYVDARRMGVHGWSYGGFMTTSLMLRQPGMFACGVAGGPVLDWSMYEVMYGERYMDMPQDNADGYTGNNLIDKVKNLKGRLLLIHGTDDDVVVWQHSIKLIKKSVDEGVQVDYFVYPGHPHNVRGKDRVHLMQKITDYFDLHLKP